ncbi:tetraacyldisaccharide 4'-kinase [Bradyrhizobium sp. SYSU BS000235]|uniref:tetraacyldisaccharide 4'-kinase n=1 Tax=Bradyrhizobium sp. SYSU BS000235 TaxID=3411332 RepID=UPI003C73660A
MREPAFWYRPPSWISRLLSPFGAIYGAVTAQRMARQGAVAGIPVFCVGNYHVGGAGKTPTTLALSHMLREMGEQPFVVSRGYGGQLEGPVRVGPKAHTAKDVGDEPLMMASQVPVIVSRDRAAGAMFAHGQGASVILLDDGFQNPSLTKDASLIVIDSGRGLGNGCVFPAGPLRAPLAPQIARTDALIVVGRGDAADDVARELRAQGKTVLRATIKPDPGSVAALSGQRVLAFAGIGDPARFFATLRKSGVNVVEEKSFDDHHPYTISDIEQLTADAQAKSLTLVTTEKDMARLHSDADLAPRAETVVAFAVSLDFDEGETFRRFVAERLARARGK